MNTNNNKIPTEVLELVPWYAMDSLSAEEKLFFNDALNKYPALSAYIETEQNIITTVKADRTILNKSALAPQSERLKAVFNSIDLQKSNTPVEKTGSLLNTLKSKIDALIPQQLESLLNVRMVSTAALIVCVAALTAFVAPLFTQDNKFTPASAVVSPTDNQANKSLNKTILLVGYNGSSDNLSQNIVLLERKVTIQSVVNRAGVFKVSFENSLTENETKQVIHDLLAQKELIWFAGESFESK